MFQKHNPQGKLFDSRTAVNDRKKRKIDTSWAAVFRKDIYPVLIGMEDQFADFFHPTQGRPNHGVAMMLGTILLKHLFDFTDELTVENFNFNVLWHQALEIDLYDCNLCRKTLYNFQSFLNTSRHHETLFDAIRDQVITKASIKTGRQRMDSVHIRSNMASLGRFRLFSRTIEQFLRDLQKRSIAAEMEEVSDLIDRYLNREGYFCDPRPSEARGKIQTAAKDLHRLVTRFERDESVVAMDSFQLMRRLFREQCTVSDTSITVIDKPSSDSLQNPSDPDAGYSGYKGQGYQAQVSETSVADNPFEVIMAVKVESACESDSPAMMETIRDLQDQGLELEEMLADTSYGSQDNVDAAAEEGVSLISPASGTRDQTNDRLSLDDFQFEESGKRMTSCPSGRSPDYQRYRKNDERGMADFTETQCRGCEHRYHCIGRILKNGTRRVSWTRKQGALSYRRRYQRTTDFKENYRARSGIEGTFSQLSNRHGGKDLRVRGFPAVHGATLMNFMAINIHRYIRHALECIKQGYLDAFDRLLRSFCDRCTSKIDHFLIRHLSETIFFKNPFYDHLILKIVSEIML
ncbi:MAG: transposase [bacterium]